MLTKSNPGPRHGLHSHAGRQGQAGHGHRHKFDSPRVDATCRQQALNAHSATRITDLVLNPDADYGYGAPIGFMVTSPMHIYPGLVGR